MRFLSTLSLRRATIAALIVREREKISIHALLAESDESPDNGFDSEKISIHALLAESDPCPSWAHRTGRNFYPRSPCGERLSNAEIKRDEAHFYPRSPCGERPMSIPTARPPSSFLSTLSLRRATKEGAEIDEEGKDFYPRSPCGERLDLRFRCSRGSHFYPRSPCGERRDVDAMVAQPAGISIHALLAESDGLPMLRRTSTSRFLSTLSLRRATYFFYSPRRKPQNFYPRSPCGERR